MISKEVLASVRADDLNADMRQIADLIGIDNLLDLVDVFMGNSIYFPKWTLLRTCKRFIVEHHRRYTPRELSAMTGLSLDHVYKVLREHRPDARQEDIPFTS